MNSSTSSILSDRTINEVDEINDLLSKMLVINPEERITIDKALEHPYVIKWSNYEDYKSKDELKRTKLKLNELKEKDYESIEDWRELIYKELIDFY